MRTPLLATLLLILAVPALADQKPTENTRRRDAGAPTPKATVAEMAWLAGRWTGKGLGGWTEETWSTPAGGTMIGMFRLVRDDQPQFYEFMTIRETERGLAIQLKHFHPDLTGWEERDKSVEFLYVGSSGRRIFFEGMTYERVSDSRVTVYLAVGKKDGTVAEQKFEMTRRK